MSAMDVDSNDFDWANDAFVALNNNDTHPTTDKWPAFNSNQAQPFTVPPALLTHASMERYGQITPPDELSPAEPRRDSAREGSIPVEQLRNEALWPEHELQALKNYQPQHAADLQKKSPPQDAEEASPKRRRSGRTSSNQSQTDPAPSQQAASESNPQPPKRKRGRPKSQPQMVDAYTTDGFPFQVSSARQSHLEKNRVAAHKCRQRKKEYINGLEGRAREFSTKNKALKENVGMLREEVLQLKNEVLRHAGCGFWAVDEYLARCAGDLLGMPSAGIPPALKQQTQAQSPAMSTIRPGSSSRAPSASEADSFDHLQDDYGGFELLEDFDDELEA